MSSPIPGVAGIEHIGLTVPDLDAATRFFVDVLGGEALYDIGPFADPADWMATNLAGHARTSIHRLRVLRIAGGPVLELIELTQPDTIAGGWHIAFYVEDIEKALTASWSADAVQGVMVSADGMLSDIHGSAAYRANLVKVMAKRAVQAAG